MSNNFHHYVRDKDGNIEMTIIKYGKEDGRFGVRFDRFSNEDTRYNVFRPFMKFCTWQLAMMLFAYDEEEFRKFEKAYAEWRNKVKDG